MSDAGLIADLQARGLIQDHTDLDDLGRRLAAGRVTVYCGFDPTADSLHVGNLFPLLLLRRFQAHGHRPIALAGGATGMIGDPGGRSEERNLLDGATLDANLAGIEGQLARFLDFGEGAGQARLVDNRDWIGPLATLDFLRDVGKHVTVNAMLAKESIRSRIESEHGISYTEFSYMLLQAYDYQWLHEHEGCDLQVGGADQWGNITAGVDLIRRASGAAVHGLTCPLLVRADGTKFGKSAAGAVWLRAERTSPYALYQYFMQVEDRDVARFLLQLTFLPVDEARAVAEAHEAAPERREGQRRLAAELTTLVHGAEAAGAAVEATALLFGGTDAVPGPEALALLDGEIPTVHLPALDAATDVVDLVAGTELASSKSDARRGLAEGALWLNGSRLDAEAPAIGPGDLVAGRYLLLRRGKKRHQLVVVDGG